jgi:Rrf2 family transcriptional regulator, iron-sulfur cluster assembly transcription factor
MPFEGRKVAMLGLSQSVRYAISALACLGEEDCGKVFVRELAKCADVPPAYLAKLFTRLVAAGIVDSKRGWKGGNQLARPPAQITLFAIAEAIEERPWINRCLLGDTECNDNRACPTHAFWSATRAAIEHELRSRTLADVIAFNAKRKREGGKENPERALVPTEPEQEREELRYGSC